MICLNCFSRLWWLLLRLLLILRILFWIFIWLTFFALTFVLITIATLWWLHLFLGLIRFIFLIFFKICFIIFINFIKFLFEFKLQLILYAFGCYGRFFIVNLLCGVYSCFGQLLVLVIDLICFVWFLLRFDIFSLLLGSIWLFLLQFGIVNLLGGISLDWWLLTFVYIDCIRFILLFLLISFICCISRLFLHFVLDTLTIWSICFDICFFIVYFFVN